MAVVQISKIQVRRGKKNSNSGIPQLSSAEFAWAVDSQELYIGNGSVADGAPYVGNTKILTEHDNLLEQIGTYQFGYSDTSITLSIPRGLQSKLDETVSVLDFGAIADGSTDCVAAFQTAFTELFRNFNPNYKKVLLVPNGEYYFASDLEIPSDVILYGETQNGAILNIGSNNIRLITSVGTGLSGFSSSDRPENINLYNCTIQRTTGTLVLTGLLNGTFEKVKFKGDYVLGDAISSLSIEPPAVLWQNILSGTKTTNVKFNNCTFESNSVAVKCTQTTAYETVIKFVECKFFIGNTGIYIEGVANQNNKWQINDCDFEELAAQAFRSSYGKGTLIQRCKFKNCGNDTGTSISPTDPIIYFGEKTNNLVIECTSDRQQDAGIVTSSSIVAIGEVYNGDKTTFIDRNIAPISLSDSFTPIAVMSAYNKYFSINYFLELGAHSRVGQLTLSVGDYLGEIAVSDHYQYSPTSISTPEGALMTNFEFSAELRDNDADSGVETVVLYYKNPLATGSTGSISFDVAYGV